MRINDEVKEITASARGQHQGREGKTNVNVFCLLREIKKRALKLRLFLRPLQTELEFCSVVYKESGNPENPEKNLPEQGK